MDCRTLNWRELRAWRARKRSIATGKVAWRDAARRTGSETHVGQVGRSSIGRAGRTRATNVREGRHPVYPTKQSLATLLFRGALRRRRARQGHLAGRSGRRDRLNRDAYSCRSHFAVREREMPQQSLYSLREVCRSVGRSDQSI